MQSIFGFPADVIDAAIVPGARSVEGGEARIVVATADGRVWLVPAPLCGLPSIEEHARLAQVRENRRAGS